MYIYSSSPKDLHQACSPKTYTHQLHRSNMYSCSSKDLYTLAGKAKVVKIPKAKAKAIRHGVSKRSITTKNG